MVLRLPNLESFIEEARRAGVTAVYIALLTRRRWSSSGLLLVHAKFVATAVGELACHAGGPEKALLRYERDFGSAPDMPGEEQNYRAKVESLAEEARDELAAAGFEVRGGVITAP